MKMMMRFSRSLDRAVFVNAPVLQWILRYKFLPHHTVNPFIIMSLVLISNTDIEWGKVLHQKSFLSLYRLSFKNR